MPLRPEPDWTRRQTLSGLASFTATGALAASRGGDHLAIADHARTLASQGAERLRLLIPTGSRANVEMITSLFTELTGVAFEVSEASVREIATSLLVRKLQGRQDFDVALPPTYEIPDLVAAGALKDLAGIDFGPTTDKTSPDGLYTNGDDFDGRAYGVQTDGDVFLMFLNKTLLEDEALRARYADRFGEEFGPPPSWSLFDRQVRFIHDTLDRPGAVLFRTQGPVEWEFWLRLHAKGYWPISLDFEPQFDNDIGQSVLEEMIAIGPFIDPGADSGRSFLPGWRRFADTGAYATFGWGGTQKLFSRPSFDLAGTLVTAQVPGGAEPGTPASLPYFNWGWSYTVAHSTPYPEMALGFIRFATSPEVSTSAVREIDGFFDPFRPEHYRDTSIRDLYGDAFLTQHRQSLSGAIPDFYIADRAAYFETLGTWLTLALDGADSPATALRNAADHWRLLTKRAGQEKQALRWRRLRAKYPPEIAARLRDVPV